MPKTLVSLLFFLLCHLQIVAQDFSTREEIDSYFKQNLSNLDPIEGFYLSEMSIRFYCCKALEDKKADGAEEVAIVKTEEGKFEIFVINRLQYNRTSYSYFKKTASAQIYSFSNFVDKVGDEVFDKKAYFTVKNFAQFSVNTTSSDRSNEFTKSLGTCSCGDAYFDRTTIFTKLYPDAQIINQAKLPKTASGTGFALTSNGYIITNNHVIEGGNNIIVKGINGDFSKRFSAKVIVTDPAIDLALLKISDTTFNSLGYVPYIIANNEKILVPNLIRFYNEHDEEVNKYGDSLTFRQ